ncbi:hypothetical protein LCGC14_1505540 [marine sediment metagenome]|uniref:Ceramide kinase PH domain-containing protein n=1 Tax=marine sediment metagenome TaxID=412755 RepID=A0A0F9J2U4_9ZZZZ
MKRWIELTTMPPVEKAAEKGHKMFVRVSEVIGVEEAGEHSYVIFQNRLTQAVKESYKVIVSMIKKAENKK